MPHLVIEYTANLTAGFDAAQALKAANRSLIESGEFEPDNIKSRVVPLADFRVGDRDEGHAFIHAHLHILPGRSESQRAAIAKRLRDALRLQYRPLPGVSTQITVEVLELRRDTYTKVVV
ncbi:5-carboxymethyl-2-hydroxymuconate Delta-isomerase [Uliginosibacterium sp. sgz301328]|uniref:5-carboxymethyl-2-hydroxymuconate Delta-isomerase n=1 Tax=Uliginosibacterium sp. sgz301328 TaxID=3243764 RepID=UPI00359EA6FD